MSNCVVYVLFVFLVNLDLIVSNSGSGTYGCGDGTNGNYGCGYGYGYGNGYGYGSSFVATGGGIAPYDFEGIVSAVKFITEQNFFRLLKVFFAFFYNTGPTRFSLDYIPFQEKNLLNDVIFGLSFDPNVTLCVFITQTFNITMKARFAVYTALLVTMDPKVKEDLITFWNNSITIDKKTEHHESVTQKGNGVSVNVYASASIVIKDRIPFHESIFEAFNQSNFQEVAMKLAWSKRDKEGTDYSKDGNNIINRIMAGSVSPEEVNSKFNKSMENTDKLLFNCSKSFAEKTLKQLQTDHQIDLLDKIKQLKLAPEILFVYQSLVDCIPYVSGYIARRIEECSNHDSLDVTKAAWTIFLTSDSTNMGRIRAEYKHQFKKELITLFNSDKSDPDYATLKLLAKLSKT